VNLPRKSAFGSVKKGLFFVHYVLFLQKIFGLREYAFSIDESIEMN